MVGDDGGESETDCRVVWWVESGFGGQWRSLSGTSDERDEALERLEWCRVHAPPAVSYRLVRRTTRVTTAVEDV
ncbi:hypothetical protein ACFWTC_32750 [Streptomyces sp. NPDC058619]|uniref:hypothetical protein n=1 Tax=unclassified Streptomyces TaxID=2593676 RepID=UPI003659B4D9